jgi:hypothetical protein
MPFSVKSCIACHKTPESEDIEISFDVLCEMQTCPECGAEEAIEIEWETEYDLEPIEDD